VLKNGDEYRLFYADKDMRMTFHLHDNEGQRLAKLDQLCGDDQQALKFTAPKLILVTERM
jgi:hypothetical protein